MKDDFSKLQKAAKEKDILLSLSTELAVVKNRKDFFEVVVAQMKSIFAIEQFGIAKINEDQKTYSAFILHSHPYIINQPGYNDLTSAEYPVNDQVFASIMGSADPILFDINHCAQE